MSYKEKLNTYTLGEGSEELRTEIEADIEKFIVIEAYLAENDLSVLKEEAYEIYQETDDYRNEADFKLSLSDFEASISKRVNRKLMKLGGWIGSIIGVIVILVIFLLPNFVGAFYFNPNKIIDPTGWPVLFFDLKANMELTQPGFDISFVSAESKGYGNYQTNYVYSDLFKRDHIIESGAIMKGTVLGMNLRSNLNLENINYYARLLNDSTFPYWFNNLEASKSYLKELSSVNYASVYIAFNQPITTKELALLNQQNESIDVIWAAVKTDDNYEENAMQLGFIPESQSSYGSDILFDDFPYFASQDWRYQGVSNFDSIEDWKAEGYANHFKALLKYAASRKNQSVFKYGFTSDDAKEALNFLEDNGIKITGVLINAEVQNILKFTDNYSNINTFIVERVITSNPNMIFRSINE